MKEKKHQRESIVFSLFPLIFFLCLLILFVAESFFHRVFVSIFNYPRFAPNLALSLNLLALGKRQRLSDFPLFARSSSIGQNLHESLMSLCQSLAQAV